MRKQQCRSEIECLLLPQARNRAVITRALDAAIPADAVVAAVGVVFEIRLIVLVAVSDEISQGKPVMGGDEVYARPRTAPLFIEEVAGP